MSANQPDWNAIAEKFDLWLPYIAPVTEQLIRRLDPGHGERILDVACGTGEPALTLARRVGGATIIGVDAAPGMVAVATAKAAREGLDHVRFDTMPGERLDFADGRFDAVICRFGVMLFADPVAGLGEMWRVLRPGGRFALAVWGEYAENSSFHMTAQVVEPLLPEGQRMPFDKITSLGIPGTLEAALEAAGFTRFEVTRHGLDYVFPDFDTWWNLLEASAILAEQLRHIGPDRRARVRDEIAALAAAYHRDGQLVLPHVYLVASGQK